VIKSKIDNIVRTIPDFPKKGISFKDITPLLLDSDITNDIIDEFIKRLSTQKIDAIVGVESRGFLFGFLLANKMNIPFIPIRKVGKLPGETIKYKYDLEYGSAEVEIHKHDVKKGWNILIHDDLLATGGTACAAAELVKQLDSKVAGFTFVINLDFLNGKKLLEKYSNNIISLTDY
jgi:adenine phosphoribosyltransferase